MNYFDVIMIIPLIWGAYKGFKKGLIIEVASLVALFLGVWGGVKFSSISANYLSKLFDVSEKIMPLISFSITFILIVIAVYALAKMLQKVIKMVALGFVNKIAGVIFAVLKFTLIISVVLTLFNNINSEIGFIDSEMESSSLLYKPISALAPAIIPGLRNISINGVVENALKKEAHQQVDEASIIPN
jgi:membrane protein required for colicin V production